MNNHFLTFSFSPSVWMGGWSRARHFIWMIATLWRELNPIRFIPSAGWQQIVFRYRVILIRPDWQTQSLGWLPSSCGSVRHPTWLSIYETIGALSSFCQGGDNRLYARTRPASSCVLILARPDGNIELENNKKKIGKRNDDVVSRG